MNGYFNTLLFGIYPYLCLTVTVIGSLIRFDREQYSWKSDSSQLLRRHRLLIGSNMFHVGVLVIVGGHFAGFLAPHAWVSRMMTASQHQWIAMAGGGAAGIVAIIGLSMLIVRRLGDPRIRVNSRRSDITIVLVLWAQLALGLATVPMSLQHIDGAMFEQLSHYVQCIVTFQPDAAALVAGVPLVYRLHILLGFTLFLVSPFTRMVHVWSGLGALAYMLRPYQIVRRR